MPGMNGAELARRVQAMRPDIPIVFVTGFVDRTALAGFSAAQIMSKPFTLDELGVKIGSTLAHRGHPQELAAPSA